MKQNKLRNDCAMRPVISNLSHNPGADIIRYARNKPDVMALGQGQGSSATPDFICQAAQRAMDEGMTFYDAVLGRDELRDEISSYYQRIYGLDLPMERLFVTGSGTTAMHLALTALLDKGDEVVAVTPIWKNLLGAIEMAQANTIQTPLDNIDGNWSLDLDKLFDSCTDNTRAILITTPSNPTGWMMSHDEMRAVLEFTRKRGIWIIADEVYTRIVFDGVHAPSFLEVADDDDNLFVVNSFSKNWAMTGWRLGWLVGPRSTEDAIRDIVLYNNMGVPTFNQFGAIEALRHGEDFLKDQIGLWRANRDMVRDRFKDNERISINYPPATFYNFFRVQGQHDCMQLAKNLIDQAGIGLAPGCAFGKAGGGHMRLCFAIDKEPMIEALDRLESYVGR
jgi:aspartate aminotransferase